MQAACEALIGTIETQALDPAVTTTMVASVAEREEAADSLLVLLQGRQAAIEAACEWHVRSGSEASLPLEALRSLAAAHQQHSSSSPPHMHPLGE